VGGGGAVKAAWALLCLALPSAASAFCPSYTASSAYNTGGCAIEAVPGTNPTVAQWQAIFDQVAQGPSSWGTAGPAVGDIGQGCGKPSATVQVPARFPCELLRAIAFRESSWRQFCVPDRPDDQIGGPSRTLIAFDCGYGVGQVTSGMRVGETPAFDRDRVAAEAFYNLATGTQILAAKWKVTQCVGDNQPAIIEHWYNATWAYNGLSYVNNPNNPAYASDRGVHDPAVGGAAPYQEKVWGAMQHPPTAGHWPSVALAYPDPAQVGGGSAPPALDEPACASPTDCVATRPVHRSSCFPSPTTDGGTPADAGVDAGGTDPQDGGPPSPDAGATEPDAGAPEPDASVEPVAPPDGGAEAPAPLPTVGGHLGCTAAPGAPLGLLLLAVAAFRRRSCVGLKP
jgi:hypothetical protein